jgi:hypothetical protein
MSCVDVQYFAAEKITKQKFDGFFTLWRTWQD